ncbi:pyrimidine dimer DNA glycosylase/endonuclease V [Bordetella petrii]|uniref:pyrimidine dimer DNA glycosylase/endonuclease V n=1 Tax=Bordetella petrii TaxID=94624 RepID=UPI003732D1CF
MTRINCVPVQELTRQHLVAEYRELPRVFALARKAWERGPVPRPAEYTLGKGHLLFFYTRLGYLARRHAELVEEMQRRGYRPGFLAPLAQVHADIPPALWGDWTPTPQALALNRRRIAERGGPPYPAGTAKA